MADTDALSAEENAILRDEGPAEAETAQATETAAETVEKPAAETAATAETVAEKVEDGTKPATESRTVPLAALHEERERRKELQQQVQAQAEKQARLDERFNLIQQRIADATKPAPIEETPIDQLQRIDAEQKRIVQATEQQNYVNQVMNTATAKAREFAVEKTDYFDAQNHLMLSRRAELTAMGLPPAQVEATINNDYLQVADQALRQGKNPAAVIYDIATHRGYRKADPVPAGKTTAELAAEKAATLAKGAAAAGSLSNAGGAPARAGASLESILAMSEKDIAALDMDKLAAMFGEPRG